MHIAEGVLSPAVLCVGYGITGIGTYLGIRAMTIDRIIPCGIFAAVFFVASLVHVPVGVTSAHLIGAGLVGLFLGGAAYPAILVALTLQAMFFQFGGITVLGVNTATMATAAVLSGMLFRSLARILPAPHGRTIAGFIAGAFGVFAAALFTALALAFSEEGFVLAAKALLLAHLPLIVAEGVLTACTVAVLTRMRPEIFPT